MRQQYIKLIGQIINVGIIVLVFIIPLVFIPLPQTTDDARLFAEFNRQIIFVAVSLILFTLWTFKMVLEKKVTIVRTPLDLPLIIFLLVYLLATAFSTDLFVSVAGFYGLFHPSLVSMFALILFYFTAVSNLDPKMRLLPLASFVLSVVIISLINTFNFFGVFLVPFEVAKAREWIPLLSPGTLAFVASLSIPVSLGLALQSKQVWLKIAALTFSIILFVPLLIINAFGAWISLLAAAVVFLIFAPNVIQRRDQRVSLAVTGALAILLLIIALTPTLRENIVQPLIRTDTQHKL